MRRFLFSVALLASIPGHSLAQDRFNWLDLISPDRIAQQLIQAGILSLRTQMDLKYGDMSVDIATGRVTLTDVRMWPLPPWDTTGDCEINIGRLTLRSNPWDQIDRLRLKAQLTRMTAPVACLPPDAREVVALSNLTTLDIPRLTIDLDYGIPGSDAVARVFGVVENAAAIDLTARFAYIWVDARSDIDDPLPVVFLKNARLVIENRGLWEALKTQIPPAFMQPSILDTMMREVMKNMNQDAVPAGPPGDPADLSTGQQEFVTSLVNAWPDFDADPQAFVLETALTSDAYLDFPAMENNPKLIFDTLKPRITLALAKTDDLLAVGLVHQATQPDGPSLDSADARRVGMALITGTGAPRDINAGTQLLAPLATKGDGEAALALSEALESRAPEEAYTWALIAGRDGQSGATARLDRLEAVLGFSRVLDLQNAAAASDSQSTDNVQSIAELREQAAMRASGAGLSRSYSAATTWAMLGKALGDAESADILSEIDEHVRLSGPDAQAAWRSEEQKASDRAISVWIQQNLPGRFSR